ncbi:DUF4232 domain-containing protein [Streptomyces sp. J2-1]|uniref:DUF4232 domain-containing protein n=1 Tax=Streptomyces corallincola TaxID=2851888 RepID=UPI001C395C0E|nr:DUF4232 domain-containing protein [Streptomyces corallincola]MBV2357520.1 DUF4232 domain-containing protein [Streptomyces corallincola]
MNETIRSGKTGARRGVAVLTAAAALAGAGALWGTTTASAAPRPAATHTCSASNLRVSLGRAEGAAGSLYETVRFTNTSKSSCALRGYPGVSVLDSAHHQIGKAATRSGRSYGTVTLKPGHSATSVLRTTNGPIGGACDKPGSYLRFYPPASTSSITVPAKWKTCSHTFQVGPVNTNGAL